MPNWCYNYVTLSNEDVAAIDALEKVLASESPEVFQHLRPMPEGEEDWYGWHLENWGTKWEMSCNDYGRDGENTIWIMFDTAWGPPTELYKFLHEQGWDVDAQYQEEGMGFIGQFVDGNDECYEYDITDRESILALPEDLIDYGDLMSRHEEWLEENEEEND